MRFPFSLLRQPMNKAKNGPTLRVKFAIGLIAVLSLAVASTAAFRSRKPIVPIKAPVAPAVQQATPLEAREKSKLEVLPIQLRPQGFVPQQIVRPAGDYLFSVGNQSGANEIELAFQQEHGRRQHEARLKKERLRWRQKVSLTPGTYLITEASHPDWVCRIIIK